MDEFKGDLDLIQSLDQHQSHGCDVLQDVSIGVNRQSMCRVILCCFLLLDSNLQLSLSEK